MMMKGGRWSVSGGRGGISGPCETFSPHPPKVTVIRPEFPLQELKDRKVCEERRLAGEGVCEMKVILPRGDCFLRRRGTIILVRGADFCVRMTELHLRNLLLVN